MSSPTLDTSRLRGIIFDLDGTLVDSYDAIADSLNTALAGLSREPLPVEHVRSMVGRGLETLIAQALGGPEGGATPDAVAQAVLIFRRRYDLICVDRTTLLPGVESTLTSLHRRGYRMCVATNKPSYFAKRLLDALSVGGLFDIVLGPDLVEHPKPHPSMVNAAMQAMRLTQRETLYVGDMEIDVQTARAAGLAVIVMPTGSRDPEELRRAGADLMVSEFGALLDWLPGPSAESRHV